MKSYDPSKIEKKWQREWDKKKLYQVKEGAKKKFYSLMEFPYPSGEGLHTGHVRGYTAMDIISRMKRMEGNNVLFPIGWDAFGLPTENYAIKTGKQPALITKNNTDNFRKQFKSLGMSFDWSREVNTTDPKYYKWTQWIFLQMFKKGLAYKAKTVINWCPKDKIGLANEEVVTRSTSSGQVGCCERCGTEVEKREKEQWMLAITKYADRLDKDLDTVDYWDKIKIQQRNWIGRSEGALIKFKVSKMPFDIEVFTTRADTLFGVTYLVLAPDGKIVQDLKSKIENWNEVEKYIESVKNKTEIDRTDATKEKTGVELKGIKVVNPANDEEVSVWLADYVLADYGTGAVMAVPAHDERDFEFAKKYKLPTKEVVIERIVDSSNPHIKGKEIIFRDAIIAVIRNPKTGKYLCLKWKKQPWTTFVMGGIEEGETAVEAAMREIKEETGYKNLKLVKVLRRAQSEFFAAHKDVNRVAHTRNILFDLQDEIQDEISEEEIEKYNIAWLSLEEIEKNGMTHSELSIILDGIKGKNPIYVKDGIIINSGKFNGLDNIEAKDKIAKEFGKKVFKYKLRDWIFSRQRYWGEPIPLIHCEKCGFQAVPDKDLPVKLPNVKKYEPTDNGESPLANISSWVNTKCPKCKGKAKRETDVMPNWAGSSWYFLRYTDPKNNKSFADKKKLKYWTPVDWYNGGMEHTTLHLLYSRFWHKFLYDLKLVPTKEPYKKRTSHGLILAEGGEKMSKSKGNVINPDSIIKVWGADSLRLYEMFMGPFAYAIAWNTDNMIGVRRFIERVWKLGHSVSKTVKSSKKVESILHKTIKKVGEDIAEMKFNTAISSLMILLNEIEKEENVSRTVLDTFLKLLAPFAPHVTEELWGISGNKKSIHISDWPKFDSKKIQEEKIKIAIQINGKVRADFEVEAGIKETEAKEKALKMPEVVKWLEGKEIKKVIFVPNKILNIVIG